jgi:hypothetical protein
MLDKSLRLSAIIPMTIYGIWINDDKPVPIRYIRHAHRRKVFCISTSSMEADHEGKSFLVFGVLGKMNSILPL